MLPSNLAGPHGIEPRLKVLETCVLPLHHEPIYLVYHVGIEPTHPEGTDLQSAATLQLRR